MMVIRRSALLLFAATLVTGCFKSDKPLIGIFESTTPIAPGIYTYTQDGKTMSALISIDWPATVRATVNEDGSSKVDRFYMRKLYDNYYIVMDAQNNYGLIWVQNKSVSVAEADDCEKLQDIEDEFELEYNEVEVASEMMCKFKSFDRLADAYKRLIEEKALKVGVVYQRR